MHVYAEQRFSEQLLKVYSHLYKRGLFKADNPFNNWSSPNISLLIYSIDRDNQILLEEQNMPEAQFFTHH